MHYSSCSAYGIGRPNRRIFPRLFGRLLKVRRRRGDRGASVDAIGLPLILLGAVWGAFSPMLKAIEMMNERRDKILDPDSRLAVPHRRLMLYSDWLAIAIATTFSRSLLGHSFLSLPRSPTSNP